MCVCVCTHAHSVVSHFVTLWAVTRQSPLPMGFSRPEYWSGLPFPSALFGPSSLKSAVASFTSVPTCPVFLIHILRAILATRPLAVQAEMASLFSVSPQYFYLWHLLGTFTIFLPHRTDSALNVGKSFIMSPDF